MQNLSPRLVHVLCLVLLTMSLTGCNNRLKTERDQLYAQNVELQDRLNEAMASLDDCLAERSRLSANLDAMSSRPVPTAPQANVTSFAGIEGVEAIESPGLITVRVPGDVLFSSGKVTLRSSALSTLDEVISVIRREYPGKTIRVLGYTDTDPIKKSKWTDNLQLSMERAAAVFRHLQKGGLEPKRLEAVGKGEWHPRSTKALSRRVEIVVVLSE